MSKEIKIIKSGSRVNLNVNGSPSVIDRWYSINSNFRVVKTGVGYGEPYDSISYVVREGDVISNEASIIVNYPPSKVVAPSGTAIGFNVIKDQIIKLSDFITYNNACDRLRVVSFSESGMFKMNGANIYPNQVIMIYDLDKLTFTAGDGQGTSYSSMQFQVGNSESYSNQLNLVISKSGSAYLDEPQTNIFENTSSTSINLFDGVTSKKAKFKINITANSIKYFNPSYQVSVAINDREITKAGEHIIEVDIDQNGQSSFEIEINSEIVINDGNIIFDVELIEMDNSTQGINLSSNKKQIIINL